MAYAYRCFFVKGHDAPSAPPPAFRPVQPLLYSLAHEQTTPLPNPPTLGNMREELR